MINSQKCNLVLQKKKQLIEMDEEGVEIGGYFIMNGSEKILRLIIVPKKNIPFAISRLANINRGYECTSFSCSYRSVDRLQTSRTIHLHYLVNGGVNVRIIIQKKGVFYSSNNSNQSFNASN
jgi:DNA-directed RNA polymerase I subunit RPA2